MISSAKHSILKLMKPAGFVSACLLVLASAGISQAEVSQYFDRSGRLVQGQQRRPAPVHQPMMKRYSLPEGIELRPDIRYEFYPVFGKTYAQIIRSVEDNSPRSQKTRRRQPSAYDWALGWTYDISYTLEPDEDSEKVHCDIVVTNPVISYDITVTLPALTDDSALNPMEKDLWKNYVATLLQQAHSRVKIIKDDTRGAIVRQFGEIAYISLSYEETENAEAIVDRAVREATEKIGSDIVRQILQNLEAYESGTTQDTIIRPEKRP